MPEAAAHIISRFTWQTTFDQKEKAAELQERLGSWSSLRLPEEAAEVFDALCPPDQTWRIQALEIELGTISLEELEPELTARLRSRLTEKLADLLLYANKGGRNIEILNDQASPVQLISSFLLHGSMPWFYKSEEGTVNQILASQLHNNRRSTVAMLKEVNAANGNARKRMAWQIREGNIIRFVEELEPGNHACITSFSTALATIQEKETVVHTGTGDFRKNLWLWILNYLFTARGSVFNKVAFLKSSIRQMAHHYNTGYQEILALIERASIQVSRKYTIKADFFTTLGVLLEENGKPGSAGEHEPGSAQSLPVRLHGLPVHKTGPDKQPPKTRLSALSPEQADSITESVSFLHGLCKNGHCMIAQKALWKTGFRIVQRSANASFNHQAFLKQCIAEISRQSRIPAAQVLGRLLCAVPSSSARTISVFRMYEALTKCFIEETVQQHTVARGACLQQLLLVWQRQAGNQTAGSSVFQVLQQVLIRSCKLYPAEALRYLKKLFDKSTLQQLAGLPDDTDFCRMLRQAGESQPKENNPGAACTALQKAARLMAVSSHAQTGTGITVLKSEKDPVCRFSNITTSFGRLADAIRKCLATGSDAIVLEGKKFYFHELLQAGMEKCPVQVSYVMAAMLPSEQRIRMLDGAIPFSRFSLLMTNCAKGRAGEALTAVRLLHQVTADAASPLPAALATDYWKLFWHIIRTNRWPAARLKELVRHSFHQLSVTAGLPVEDITARIKSRNLPPAVVKMLVGHHPGFASLPAETKHDPLRKKLQHTACRGRLNELISRFIMYGQLPVWMRNAGEAAATELLEAIATHYPAKLLHTLRHGGVATRQMDWLSRSLGFNMLVCCIGHTNKDRLLLLRILEKFHAAWKNISISCIAAEEVQRLLQHKVIKAWMNDNWKTISTEQVWNELLWEVCVKKGVSGKTFLAEVQKAKSCFPPALQVSLESIAAGEAAAGTASSTGKISKLPFSSGKKTVAENQVHLPVRNAGLVLVSSYIPLLFKRLGIHDSLGGTEKPDQSIQSDAVHYLQYIVTGLCSTDEYLLPLNKLLCGLPLHQPVYSGIVMPHAHKTLIDEMIAAITGYWPAIGACSVNGFRGNWLVRDGLLKEYDDKWELTVKKRAYDVLLTRSPFSFSIIRYPWMEKPLHVSWPY